MPEQSINIHHKMNMGRGWDRKNNRPQFEGYFRDLKSKPGNWYIEFKGNWYATEPGPYGEQVADLNHKTTVTIYIVW